MSSQARQESKYSYKFTLEARRPGSTDLEPSKAEIQAYINEVLGITKKTEQKDWATV